MCVGVLGFRVSQELLDSGGRRERPGLALKVKRYRKEHMDKALYE